MKIVDTFLGQSIAEMCGKYAVQYCGDEILFDTIKEACDFIQEVYGPLMTTNEEEEQGQ